MIDWKSRDWNAVAIIAFIVALAVVIWLTLSVTRQQPVAQEFPGEPYPPDPECVAFFTGRGDGTIPQPFDRLPNICQWRYAGFPCEPEQDPPEGWLVPGGYCDIIRNPQSISPPG